MQKRMEEKRIVLPPFNKWSPKFKQVFFEKLSDNSYIDNEDDMEEVKEIILIYKDKKILFEIIFKSEFIEMQKKDLPSGIKKQLTE